MTSAIRCTSAASTRSPGAPTSQRTSITLPAFPMAVHRRATCCRTLPSTSRSASSSARGSPSTCKPSTSRIAAFCLTTVLPLAAPTSSIRAKSSCNCAIVSTIEFRRGSCALCSGNKEAYPPNSFRRGQLLPPASTTQISFFVSRKVCPSFSKSSSPPSASNRFFPASTKWLTAASSPSKKSASSSTAPPRSSGAASCDRIANARVRFQADCCRILLAFHLHSAGEVGVNQFGDRARYTLAILFAINLLNFYDRQILGALVEPIRKQWALTDSQIGWLATAFTLLYAVVGVPFGRLSDRWKRPQLLSLGVAAWSLLTAASGFAWGYGSLFAARLGVGVGEATCAPAANSLIGDLYPAARRARALSLFMLGLPLGGFLGFFVSGHVAARYGWRMAFYIACLPGLLLAVFAMRLFDAPRGAAESSPLAGRPHQGSPYWSV